MDIKKIYFIGIGGIGMSALARYFKKQGAAVYGYDRTETDLTRALANEGIQVHYEDDTQYIPEGVDLAVWTPAVPSDHKELNWFRENGVPLKKRAEVLGIISQSRRCVAVAGTHGKTTTSSMTAHFMRAGGIDATAFLGGIALNLKNNFVEGDSDWVVAEADEYDRSFLHLHPEIAILNSMDPDHLDIYGTPEAVVETYKKFIRQIKPGGTLIYKYGLPIDDVAAELKASGRLVYTFGIEKGDFRAENIQVSEGKTHFTLRLPEAIKQSKATLQNGIQTGLWYPGRHNVENATAAAAAALTAGVPVGKINRLMGAFKGVRRRFEYWLRKPERVLVDDYAHHPAELEAAIQAAKSLYPDRKVTGIFQPHLYTRTRDFAEGFAAALDKLDECILLDIYPAREQPIPGITSETIFNLMKSKNKQMIPKKALIDLMKSRTDWDVVLTMGAGDIDTFLKKIKATLLGIG